jgi:hypothetical protein
LTGWLAAVMLYQLITRVMWHLLMEKKKDGFNDGRKLLLALLLLQIYST